MRDSIVVVGSDLEHPGGSRIVANGIVCSAQIQVADSWVDLRVGISGTARPGWSMFRWERGPQDREHTTLAEEIVAAVELALATISGTSITAIDKDPDIARALLHSLAYTAIAGSSSRCRFDRPSIGDLRPASAGARRG